MGVHNNPYTITQGTGYTLIGSVTNNDPEVGAEYKTVATTQTNLPVGCTLNNGGNDWAMIADAIKGP
jgi:predicted secreted Zn-dependent protease